MDIDIPPRKSKKLFLIGILILFFLSNICQRTNKGVHEIDTKSKISGKNSYLKFEICFDIILKSEKNKKTPYKPTEAITTQIILLSNFILINRIFQERE